MEVRVVLGDEQLGMGDLFFGVKPVDVQGLVTCVAASKVLRMDATQLAFRSGSLAAYWPSLR